MPSTIICLTERIGAIGVAGLHIWVSVPDVLQELIPASCFAGCAKSVGGNLEDCLHELLDVGNFYDLDVVESRLGLF